MVSEDQKKKYEEAADHWAEIMHGDKAKLLSVRSINEWDECRFDYLRGCQHAHPIAHSEGKKEGWNEAIQFAMANFEDYGDEPLSSNDVIKILQIIRK